jgi:hypothetical protein
MLDLEVEIEAERNRESERRKRQREQRKADVAKWKGKSEELAQKAEAAVEIGSRNLKARDEAEAQVRECHAMVEPMKGEIAGLRGKSQR